MVISRLVPTMENSMFLKVNFGKVCRTKRSLLMASQVCFSDPHVFREIIINIIMTKRRTTVVDNIGENIFMINTMETKQ